MVAHLLKMPVVKVGGNRGRVLAQIEERNEKLRRKQEMQYTKEIYRKFDAVSQPAGLDGTSSTRHPLLLRALT